MLPGQVRTADDPMLERKGEKETHAKKGVLMKGFIFNRIRHQFVRQKVSRSQLYDKYHYTINWIEFTKLSQIIFLNDEHDLFDHGFAFDI